MILNSKIYDALKYLTIIVLPAIGALYTGLAQIWSLPYSAQVPATITVICTFLGAILCISSAEYNRAPYGMYDGDEDNEYLDEDDDEEEE